MYYVSLKPPETKQETGFPDHPEIHQNAWVISQACGGNPFCLQYGFWNLAFFLLFIICLTKQTKRSSCFPLSMFLSKGGETIGNRAIKEGSRHGGITLIQEREKEPDTSFFSFWFSLLEHFSKKGEKNASMEFGGEERPLTSTAQPPDSP